MLKPFKYNVYILLLFGTVSSISLLRESPTVRKKPREKEHFQLVTSYFSRRLFKTTAGLFIANQIY